MICKNCGKEIADNSVFCTECGARVSPEEPKTIQAEMSAEQTPPEVPAEQAASEAALHDDAIDLGVQLVWRRDGLGRREHIDRNLEPGQLGRRQRGETRVLAGGQDGVVDHLQRQVGLAGLDGADATAQLPPAV